MRLSLVDIAALPDAGVEGSNGMGAKSAPDDGFVSVLRDISDGADKAGRHSEAHQEAAVPLTGDEPDSVSLDQSLEGVAEPKEGSLDFLEDRGDEEPAPPCDANLAAMPLDGIYQGQAAAPLLNAIEKAADEDASRPVSGSPMSLEDRIGMADGPVIQAGQGMAPSADESDESIEIPEPAAYADAEENKAFDIRSFKDAGANAPEMPIRPEGRRPSDAASGPAYQAGDVKVIAEANGHEATADGLERKAGDVPMKAEGQNPGPLPYISGLSGRDSDDGSGHNSEGNDKGADRYNAGGDIDGVSGSGTHVFSMLNEAGGRGKDHASNAATAGPSGADAIYQRIEDAVSSIRSKAVSSIRLRLHPENMGEMGLSLTESDSVISARITVTSLAVRDLLDSDSSRLRDIFLAEGLSLGKCSVELASNFSSNDSRGFMPAWDDNGHGGRIASATQARPAADRGREKGLMGAYGPSAAGRGGIDVFV